MDHDHRREDGDCREVFAQLSAYLDGELTPEARRAMERHLCDCPPCIEFVESLRRTVDLCRRFEPDGAPGPLTAEARERLLAACRRMVAARSGQSRL
ncbi:MAG: anti-sigma factor [Bryobacteraceae bacterium]